MTIRMTANNTRGHLSGELVANSAIGKIFNPSFITIRIVANDIKSHRGRSFILFEIEFLKMR